MRSFKQTTECQCHISFQDPDAVKTLCNIHEKKVRKAQINILLSAKRIISKVYFQSQTQKIIAAIGPIQLPHILKQRKWKTINMFPPLVSLPKTMIVIYRLHDKNPYKHLYIAGSVECTTSPILKLVTPTLTEDLQAYHDICYPRCGINSMWIRKKFKRFSGNSQIKMCLHIIVLKPMILNSLYFFSQCQIKSRLRIIIHRCQ